MNRKVVIGIGIVLTGVLAYVGYRIHKSNQLKPKAE